MSVRWTRCSGALLALVEIFRHSRPKRQSCHSECQRRICIDFYLSHTNRINNWDFVDLSCYPLLGEWLLDKDRTLLYNLPEAVIPSGSSGSAS